MAKIKARIIKILKEEANKEINSIRSLNSAYTNVDAQKFEKVTKYNRAVLLVSTFSEQEAQNFAAICKKYTDLPGSVKKNFIPVSLMYNDHWKFTIHKASISTLIKSSKKDHKALVHTFKKPVSLKLHNHTLVSPEVAKTLEKVLGFKKGRKPSKQT